MPKSEEPVPAPLFYCVSGDHNVNEVVWLEQLAMGCQDCMVKMREKIDSSVKLRLWRVSTDGLVLVNEPKPKPKCTKCQVFDASPLSAHCSRCTRDIIEARHVAEAKAEVDLINSRVKSLSPFKDSPFKNPFELPKFVAQPYDHRSYEQFMRAGDRQNIRDLGPKDRDTDPLAQALKAIQDASNITSTLDEIAAVMEPPIKEVVSGGNKTITRGPVPAYGIVKASGGNCTIEIDGDVGRNAEVTVSGGNGTIIIRGYVHQGATVKASGGNGEIVYQGRDEATTVKATGGNGDVRDLGRIAKAVPRNPIQKAMDDFQDLRAIQEAREQLAKLYQIPFPAVGSPERDRVVKTAYPIDEPAPVIQDRRRHVDHPLGYHSMLRYRKKADFPTVGQSGTRYYDELANRLYLWTFDKYTEIVLPTRPTIDKPLVRGTTSRSYNGTSVTIDGQGRITFQ